jgi:hypothetical protein
MDSTRLPTNQEDREVYLRECGLDDFVDALKERQQTGAVLVQALNPTWSTDAIYVAVEYIREKGVGVTLAIQDWDEGPEIALRALRKGAAKPWRRPDSRR